jgi:hypothetical protein
MKCFSRVGFVAVAFLAVAAVAFADELKSGLQPEQPIPAFDVTKVAGAADDGVNTGDTLCYRCKYGKRPMVMIFTRKTDENLAALVKQLDEAVSKNQDKQLKAFVNVMGESPDAAKSAAKEFASKNKFTNVPVVVPVEYSNGPDNYGINPKADVTILVASNGKVTANHTFEKGLSCEACVESVIKDVNKLVKE